MHKNKKFISIIWGYHKQIFSFEKEQNYHMHPIQVMIDQGYECEIFSIDASVRIEDDPNFIPGVNVIYFKNIFQYILYLLKNRSHIIYSNSLTIKTLLVGVIGKKTVFYPHSYPFGHSFMKERVIRLFYIFFSKIRVNNNDEYDQINEIKRGLAYLCPLAVSNAFYDRSVDNRKGASFIGNLTNIKRPEELISTMSLLRDKNESLQLHIIGEDRYDKNGEDFQKLIIRNKLEDNIILHGYLKPDEIRDILGQTLIYINTSQSEGQCLAVYEAALAGNILCLPPILSFPSVFCDNAYYHESPDQLVENIENILAMKDRENNTIKENQNMILSKYNYDKISEELFNMFVKL